MAAAVAMGLRLLAVFFLVCLTAAELYRLPGQPIKADGSLAVLVVGDWGRKGLYNQTQVAAQMGRIGEELEVDFVISTGDNFYEDGLTGVDDPAFEQSFTNIYTASSLQKPWFSVLGNHDYRGDVLAQLNPALQKLDRRWTCRRSFVLDAEIVEFFFIDTTPFVVHYWTNPNNHSYDWREVAPRRRYVSNLLGDLDSALKESTARWKVVVGHHTVRSVSSHGDTEELVGLLLPLLKENGVDLYINGHDHCLEHIGSRDSPLQFLTSGGGSKAWRGVVGSSDDELLFFHDGQGFMALEITSSHLKLVFYDINGRSLHDWTFFKHPFSSWEEDAI